MRVIPEVLLVNLSQTTQVDHYAKVLHGKKMFYLLLYGILENEKLSQRSLEDTFNDPIFKNLFDLDPSERIARSSISEKLSKIDSDYFVQIYQCLYTQFQQAYPDNNSLKYNLVYVESSMMSDAATRLAQGIDHNNGKKSVKYSVAFDGLLPCYFDVFTDRKYSSEDIALPEAIHGHIKKENGQKKLTISNNKAGFFILDYRLLLLFYPLTLPLILDCLELSSSQHLFLDLI